MMLNQNKDPNSNVEGSEVADDGNMMFDNRITDLEAQLQSCLTEKRNLNIRLDEITHTLGNFISRYLSSDIIYVFVSLPQIGKMKLRNLK